MTLMIFILVMLDAGGNKTGVQLAFQELTSFLEYRDALTIQSTDIHNYVDGRKTNKFDAYCEVSLIPQSEAGKGKYIFRDPVIKREDD